MFGPTDKVPAFWDPQQGVKSLLIILKQSGKEYKKVEQKFHQTSSRQVIQIERVQNPELYKQYMAKKESMDKAPNTTYGANEMLLYHGSDQSTIAKICTQGFNRSFAGRNGMCPLAQAELACCRLGAVSFEPVLLTNDLQPRIVPTSAVEI